MLKQLKRLSIIILDFANGDFCPAANQYVYWIKQPIGWVIGAIMFSVLVGVFVGSQGYVLATAFGALLIVGLVWPWVSMKGVRCTLLVPDHQLRENQEFEITFKVQNYWPIPVFGLMVKGNFLQDLKSDEEPIAFSLRRIPAWADTEFQIPITVQRRGVFPDGNVEILNGFPFGLSTISRDVSVPQSATVWPACEALDGQPKSITGLQSILGSLCDRSGHDGDTIGVRTWQMGDRLKSIHWAQSARSQRLMVRERQTLASTTVLVILDLSPENHIGEGVQSSFEWAIRLAASVCWQLHQNRSDVQVALAGLELPGNQRIDNRLGVERLMDTFAQLPSLSEAKLTAKSSWRRHDCLPAGSSVFLVGTTKSTYHGAVNVNKVLINLKGFGPVDQWFEDDRKTDLSEVETSVLVTAPSLAAAELKSDWSRSFSNAAS